MTNEQKNYWKERAEEWRRKRLASEKEAAAQRNATYLYHMDKIDEQIDTWLAKYASKRGMTMAEARQAVKATDAAGADTHFGYTSDFGNLANIAAALMGQNNNSVHTLANSILGAGTTHGVDVTGGVSANMMANFANAIFSDGKVGSSTGSGIDLGTLINLAGLLFSSK